MPKPPAEWTEEDVLSLPSDENDSFERKGPRLIDLTLSGVNEGDVRSELAKQLSAFANTGGGVIIYGVDDSGQVELGGVSRTIKGRQSTKDWLESLIPTLTDFEIIGANVFEVKPSKNQSKLHPQKSLYLVEIPDSERAPHQSTTDHRYYVRLGGRSQPASHKLIEDIRNRSRHPRVIIDEPRLTHVMPPRFTAIPNNFCANLDLRLRFLVKNSGRVKATDTCLAVQSSQAPLTNFRLDCEFSRQLTVRESPWRFFEIQRPIYPDFEFDVGLICDCAAELTEYDLGKSASWCVPGSNTQISAGRIIWRIFADSAPVGSGEIRFEDLGFRKKLFDATEASPQKLHFQCYFDPHKSIG